MLQPWPGDQNPKTACYFSRLHVTESTLTELPNVVTGGLLLQGELTLTCLRYA